MTIKKAIIPAAGLGINFLPLSKNLPKELLPIVNKTCLEHVIEEGISAGLNEFVIVISKEKEIIRNYFEDHDYMKNWLNKRGYKDLIPELNTTPQNATIKFVYQEEPLGLGHAVNCASQLVTDDYFFVLLPDDIIDAETSVTKQMLNIFSYQKRPVISVMEVAWEDVCRYGIVKATPISEQVGDVQDIVEKPAREKAPSNLAVMGRYLLSREIFSYIEQTKPDTGGEIQLTDAIKATIEQTGLNSYVFEGERFDTGEPLGLLKASLSFSLKHPLYKDKMQKMIKILSTGI